MLSNRQIEDWELEQRRQQMRSELSVQELERQRLAYNERMMLPPTESERKFAKTINRSARALEWGGLNVP